MRRYRAHDHAGRASLHLPGHIETGKWTRPRDIGEARGMRTSSASTQPAWFGITPGCESKGRIKVARPGRDVALYPFKRRIREVGRDRGWGWDLGRRRLWGILESVYYVSWKEMVECGGVESTRRPNKEITNINALTLSS